MEKNIVVSRLNKDNHATILLRKRNDENIDEFAAKVRRLANQCNISFELIIVPMNNYSSENNSVKSIASSEEDL